MKIQLLLGLGLALAANAFADDAQDAYWAQRGWYRGENDGVYHRGYYSGDIDPDGREYDRLVEENARLRAQLKKVGQAIEGQPTVPAESESFLDRVAAAAVEQQQQLQQAEEANWRSHFPKKN